MVGSAAVEPRAEPLAAEPPAAEPLAAEPGVVPPVAALLAVPVAVSLAVAPVAVPVVVGSAVEPVEPVAPAAGPVVAPVAGGLVMFVVAPPVSPWPPESPGMPRSRPRIGGPARTRKFSPNLLVGSNTSSKANLQTSTKNYTSLEVLTALPRWSKLQKLAADLATIVPPTLVLLRARPAEQVHLWARHSQILPYTIPSPSHMPPVGLQMEQTLPGFQCCMVPRMHHHETEVEWLGQSEGLTWRGPPGHLFCMIPNPSCGIHRCKLVKDPKI